MSLALLWGEYFYLRQRLPLFLYLFYVFYKDVDDPIIDRSIEAALVLIGALTVYASVGFTIGIPFAVLINGGWGYQGLITWGLFFLIGYNVALKATHSKLTAFTLTTLAATGGGWLYEIPFYHAKAMFISLNSVFYLNAQITCLIILAYEFKKRSLRPNKYIYLTFSVFVVASILLFDNLEPLRYWHTWIMRLPTCLLLISLLNGIKGEATK